MTKGDRWEGERGGGGGGAWADKKRGNGER